LLIKQPIGEFNSFGETKDGFTSSNSHRNQLVTVGLVSNRYAGTVINNGGRVTLIAFNYFRIDGSAGLWSPWQRSLATLQPEMESVAPFDWTCLPKIIEKLIEFEKTGAVGAFD